MEVMGFFLLPLPPSVPEIDEVGELAAVKLLVIPEIEFDIGLPQIFPDLGEAIEVSVVVVLAFRATAKTFVGGTGGRMTSRDLP